MTISARARLAASGVWRATPVELLLGHAGSGEGALALDLGGGAHHHEAIHGAVAANLEQQRNIEDDERLLRRRGGRDEAGFGLVHQRMDDGFERRQGGRVGEQQGGEPVAIDGAIDQRFGEERCNRGDGAAAAAEQAMDRGRHRTPGSRARRTSGRFATCPWRASR